MRKLLKELNFRFKKRNQNSNLKEKDEIISWRRRYLPQIKKYREDGKTIYYLDETWVNTGHTVKKVWTDMSILTARQAFVEGLSTGLKNPSGKGKRVIILHIGSEKGFVENGLLLFESKKTGDYHEDMDSKRFEQWFENILLTLEENRYLIILDNASYHSRKLDKPPNSNSRKAEIQTWLTSQNIGYEQDMVKAELLSLVKQNTGQVKQVIDEMARDSNRTVLRLPTYHCELNPIELIWAQTKGHVARNNKTFKQSDVKRLFEEAIQNVTAVNWANAIKHVISTKEKMWELDAVMETHVESLIIDIGNETESSSSEDDN